MKQPHKHAELIKAWADGAEIEVRNGPHDSWSITRFPAWCEHLEYRIKPEPKPDVVWNVYAKSHSNGVEVAQPWVHGNLRLTFDGETGQLKDAEVLK